MSERLEFVRRWEEGERVVDLCHEFGISRKTAYKLKERYEVFGARALFDRSHAPRTIPHRTPPEVEKVLLGVRGEHPTWGPKKIRAYLLKHQPGLGVPCASTIGDVLKRNGVMFRKRRRRSVMPRGAPLRVAQRPNDIWWTRVPDSEGARTKDGTTAERRTREGALIAVARGGAPLAFASRVARIPREMLVEHDSTNHCTWRAHDHERVFDEEGAREKFLEVLGKYKGRHGILVHSYCLMGTHPHVVCTSTRGKDEFSRFWKVVNHAFAWWFNRRRNRRGQVVMERLRSPRIQGSGNHQLTVMRYGDLNPVRAGLVRSPKDWRWSTYRHYAFGEPNALIDPAPEFLALGRTGAARRKAYQSLFAAPLVAELCERRADLVMFPFVGDASWVATRIEAAGLSPPSRRKRYLA